VQKVCFMYIITFYFLYSYEPIGMYPGLQPQLLFCIDDPFVQESFKVLQNYSDFIRSAQHIDFYSLFKAVIGFKKKIN
jgi:hypothetical protein